MYDKVLYQIINNIFLIGLDTNIKPPQNICYGLGGGMGKNGSSPFEKVKNVIPKE